MSADKLSHNNDGTVNGQLTLSLPPPDLPPLPARRELVPDRPDQRAGLVLPDESDPALLRSPHADALRDCVGHSRLTGDDSRTQVMMS